MVHPSPRVSLLWPLSAWLLFRTRPFLWVAAASVQLVTFVLSGLLVTGYLNAPVHAALSAMKVPSLLDGPIVVIASCGLFLTSLAANIVMTAMASRVVLGGSISGRDIFRHRGRNLFRHHGFGTVFLVTSLALGITLLAAALGSLLFFVGSFVATGLLFASQAAALRTGKLGSALLASTASMRSDPVRALALAAFLLAALTLGVATGGLGLLVAIPIAKILGALADAYAETLGIAGPLPVTGTHPAKEPLIGAGPVPIGAGSVSIRGLMPPAVQFHWTAGEEAILKQTAPPPHVPRLLAALMVIGLAAFLLFPRLPAATADLPPPQEAAQPATATQTAPEAAQDAPEAAQGAPDPPVPSAPSPSENSSSSSRMSAADSAFVDSYGDDSDEDYNYPPLPCRMHWGSYTVRIEEVGSAEGPDGLQNKITILDTAGLTVYTLTDEQIGLVKPEPLLGGEQPELLIRTAEGGDGTHGSNIGLTQQGGVHPVFVISDGHVTPLHQDGQPSEEIVVDTSLDGPYLDVHHFPKLTSTYRWNGSEFVNATASSPGPTQARMKQYEQVLTDPNNIMHPTLNGSANNGNGTDGNGTDRDDWATSMETAAVGLLANAALMGQPRLPASITSTQGYQLGIRWLRENTQSRVHIVQEISEAKNPLPITDKGTDGENSLPEQSNQP